MLTRGCTHACVREHPHTRTHGPGRLANISSPGAMGELGATVLCIGNRVTARCCRLVESMWRLSRVEVDHGGWGTTLKKPAAQRIVPTRNEVPGSADSPTLFPPPLISLHVLNSKVSAFKGEEKKKTKTDLRKKFEAD